MKITFDAIPLTAEKMTGIGWCEAGQTAALAALYPENTYEYSFFTDGKGTAEERIRQLSAEGIGMNTSRFPKKLYRGMSAVLPVPYSHFFGESDITHFFNYILPPGVEGRTVVTVHDMVYKAFPETVRGRTRLMLNMGLKSSMERADRIVTDSEFSKSEIIKYFPEHEGKIRVVPCGVNSEMFSPCTDSGRIEEVRSSLGISGDYFLYLGTIEPRKNLERLIMAYGHFIEESGEGAPELVLAGGKGWLYDGIFARVRSMGLENKVIFTKYVPSEDMAPLMSGALAFVFPSLYEGFGMPPLEAMSCGTPVLCSGAASLPEVTGDCAVICDPYSVRSITAGLRKLYRDSGLRRELSTKGLERAKDFTWERSAEMLMEIYEELMK